MLFPVLFSYIINSLHADDNPVCWVLLHMSPFYRWAEGGRLLIVPHLGTGGF